MTRRELFLQSVGLAAAGIARSAPASTPLGLNTYCLRALRWNDRQLLDYTDSLKLDAIFLQDSVDPGVADPAHWKEVRETAQRLGLRLETGGGAVLPQSPDRFDASVNSLRQAVERAKAMGSPVVRCLHAADREHMPPGPIEQHIETMIRVLRAVRPQVTDAGMKLALENHKDLQAFEMKEVIEGAGKEFVGSYLDTGNPVFVLEHPMTTLETLGPYAVTVHLRDSVVYEHPRGVAVQWVPLGEGVVDFKRFVARMKEVCPPTAVYVKPITGRPPAVLPYLEREYWQRYSRARAGDLAAFLALAKAGRPYENHMVIEDLPGRTTPPAFAAAVQYQQREHMERSVEYAKKILGLGVRSRS